MYKFYGTLVIFSLCNISASNIFAFDVINEGIVHFPKVTEQRAINILDLAMKAQEAATNSDRNTYISVLYVIKKEVEYMMSAKMRLNDFIEDAFEQAERKGIKFSEYQQDQCRRSLMMANQGFAGNFPLNNMAYQTYEEQKHYQTPIKLEAGLTLVIIGTLIAVIPYPGCAPTGQIIAGTGFAFMADACIQGLENQKKNK